MQRVEAGAGEPTVVLETEVNCGAASWQRVMPLLAPHVRCVTGLRVTPVSTKAVDAAAVLFESVRPLPEPAAGWAGFQPPYHGLPGEIYLSEHLLSACVRLGISVQPARVYQGTDKAPLERFFRTLGEQPLVALPGWMSWNGSSATGQRSAITAIGGLRYDGPALNPYRNRTSPFAGKDAGRWPIRVDPGDVSKVWFQDPADSTFHVLRWEHASAVGGPFSSEALAYARQLAAATHRFPDTRRALAELLDQWNAGLAATEPSGASGARLRAPPASGRRACAARRWRGSHSGSAAWYR